MSISSATSATAAARISATERRAPRSVEPGSAPAPTHKAESSPGAIPSQPAQPTMTTMGTGSKVNTVA